MKAPHREKLIAALANPRLPAQDIPLLEEAFAAYREWLGRLNALQTTGKARVTEMVALLNQYKDLLEVELMAERGSAFLKRQRGQLKLASSVNEEFLMHLVRPEILLGLPETPLKNGPRTSFMSLSFIPTSVEALSRTPNVMLKVKDQDFVLGKTLYYKFSPDYLFPAGLTQEGNLFLAVFATECKVNFDKTMFQECAATAARLKQGCPVARYFVVVEYLDMAPEDCRLTEIDNVFILRKARRLPPDKRSDLKAIKKQRALYPIDTEVVWKFTQQLQTFIDMVWYDPEQALVRGSFV